MWRHIQRLLFKCSRIHVLSMTVHRLLLSLYIKTVSMGIFG